MLRDQNAQMKTQMRKLEEHVQYLTQLLETNTCPKCERKLTPLSLQGQGDDIQFLDREPRRKEEGSSLAVGETS